MFHGQSAEEGSYEEFAACGNENDNFSAPRNPDEPSALPLSSSFRVYGSFKKVVPTSLCALPTIPLGMVRPIFGPAISNGGALRRVGSKLHKGSGLVGLMRPRNKISFLPPGLIPDGVIWF